MSKQRTPDHVLAGWITPCRNCDNGVRRKGGLCYECWHWLTYGRDAEPNELRGDGAARNLKVGPPDRA